MRHASLELLALSNSLVFIKLLYSLRRNVGVSEISEILQSEIKSLEKSKYEMAFELKVKVCVT